MCISLYHHDILNIAAIGLFVSCAVGVQVLKKAHRIDTPTMKRNSSQGKKNTKSICSTRFYYRLIVYPTITPIKTPNKQEETTRIKASQKYRSFILIFVTPIDLRIATSFFYSYKFVAIDAQREKKHKNIVMLIIEQNTPLMMRLILSLSVKEEFVVPTLIPGDISLIALTILSAVAVSDGSFICI